MKTNNRKNYVSTDYFSNRGIPSFTNGMMTEATQGDKKVSELSSQEFMDLIFSKGILSGNSSGTTSGSTTDNGGTSGNGNTALLVVIVLAALVLIATIILVRKNKQPNI